MALTKTMKARDTTIAEFKMAVIRPVVQSLIFHSDRGIQYACDKFRQELGAYPLNRQTMSRRANCWWDKAVAESFFKTLKVECVYDYKFVDQQEAANTVFEYIEIWYNRKRIHSSLGYRTPAHMEEILNQYALVA